MTFKGPFQSKLLYDSMKKIMFFFLGRKKKGRVGRWTKSLYSRYMKKLHLYSHIPAYSSWKFLSLVTSSSYAILNGAMEETSTNIIWSDGPVSGVGSEGQRVRLTSW